MHELVTTIALTKYAKTQEFVRKVKEGASFLEMLQNGQIPAPQFNQWLQMYQYINGCMPYRNGRATHTPRFDEDTGELIEDDES